MDEEQGFAPQDPSEQATAGGTPWDADLASRFEDEEIRNQVSEYLRENVQPYTTRLEQAASGNEKAQALWDAFAENPERTVLEVVAEVYEDDPEKAKAIAAVIEAQEPTVEDPAREVQSDPPVATLDPRIERLLAREEENEEREAFNEEFDRVSEKNPDLKINRKLFTPLVAQAGDFDQAVADYRELIADLGGPVEDPAAGAPQPLGTGSATGGVEPPVEQKFGSMDEAIDSLMDDLRAKDQSLAPAPPQAA